MPANNIYRRKTIKGGFGEMIMDRIALLITIVGALNWGSIIENKK